MIEYISDLSRWHQYKGYIQRALDKSCGELAIQDIYQRVDDGRMGLLDIHGKAACVIEFMDYPQITALRVVALGGEDMDEWLDELQDFLYRWAEENHMDRIEHNGRKGWIKTLKDYGYKERYTFMTRDIDHG